MAGQPSDNVGDFLWRHRVARRITSPVRSALVVAAGYHRCPEGLIAHKCKESRIDNRSRVRAARPFFTVTSRAICVEGRLPAFWVAQIRATRTVWRQSNSDKLSWS
jgi:hypothetical protein